jgi:acetyl-CoA acetyltransferase
MAEAYIVAATRTAGGRKNGKLKDWHPGDLGGAVIDNLLDRTGADPALVRLASSRPISRASAPCLRGCRS